MVAQPMSYEDMRREMSQVDARERAIIGAAVANGNLLALWERSNELARREGTSAWVTLDELKRRYAVPR